VIASLLNVPDTPETWSRWTFALSSDTAEIQQAIQTQLGVMLPTYQLDPLPAFAAQEWLERNQQAHNDFNGALGLQGSDLESVNLKDRRERESWVWLVYRERQAARSALQI
jgi:hypothetical protein